jgi:hypothetical protein
MLDISSADTDCVGEESAQTEWIILNWKYFDHHSLWEKGRTTVAV